VPQKRRLIDLLLTKEKRPLEETETFFITDKEYGALINIRGLKEKAHLMVMSANGSKSGGYTLKGSSEAFDELTSDLDDEIIYELSPKYRCTQLQKLYRRLTPDEDF
jgi:hypothetical protein